MLQYNTRMSIAKREFTVENEYSYNRTSAVRWIASHLWRYPLLPLIVLLAAIFNNFAYSYVQLFVGQAFDVIVQDDWQTAVLLSVAVSAFLATAAQGFLGLIRNYTNEFIAQRIERDARDEFYISLLGKSQTFHGKQRIGDIMARATNDVRTLNVMFSPGLMLIVDSFMGIVAPIVTILSIDGRLLLVPSLFLVAFVLTVSDYARQLNPVSIKMREQFGVMNAGLAESIAGIEVVKGNAQEAQEQAKFVENASLYRDHFIQQGEIQARYLPMLMFSLAWGASFYHAMILWQADQLTLGQVVAFMGLVGVLRFPTFVSIFSFNLVQLGIASAGRILEMLNEETFLDENSDGVTQPIQGKVTFENVTFGYEGKPILHDLSFTVEAGKTVALVGQTGSGKTTLTRLINRIFDVTEGRVLVDGVDVRDWQLASLRSQISTIEQDIFLFSRTIAENIAFGNADATPEEIENAAKLAQAHTFIMGFKDGYQTEIGERGVMLSGGQRQRLAIARAFLTKPHILVLDDSTSAIDSATEDQIQQAMRQISRRQTTFLITHRLSQIRWADHILLLKNGRLAAQGSHEELLARSPDYQRIFARYE